MAQQTYATSERVLAAAEVAVRYLNHAGLELEDSRLSGDHATLVMRSAAGPVAVGVRVTPDARQAERYEAADDPACVDALFHLMELHCDQPGFDLAGCRLDLVRVGVDLERHVARVRHIPRVEFEAEHELAR